ncbi:uncharacterized protein LOC128908785 [Rissa tridactyla]|uniref:uncharacterized protein LOC128908785 n=1 Tax=Rissa tridactyla TaxID=75485 RepID=UPI0023BB141F|nr:uncharacterized protein LOC128908785 [Rissa tridactyla]
MLLHFSITAGCCASVSPSAPAGEGMLRAGVGGGLSGEVRHPGLLCWVGRVGCLLPGDELGAGRTSRLSSQNRYFLCLPWGCFSVAAPLCLALLLASRGWHPCVPHLLLPLALPANPSPLEQPPRPEAFASPDSVASRSGGSLVLAKGAGSKAPWHICLRSGSALPRSCRHLGMRRGRHPGLLEARTHRGPLRVGRCDAGGTQPTTVNSPSCRQPFLTGNVAALRESRSPARCGIWTSHSDAGKSFSSLPRPSGPGASGLPVLRWPRDALWLSHPTSPFRDLAQGLSPGWLFLAIPISTSGREDACGMLGGQVPDPGWPQPCVGHPAAWQNLFCREPRRTSLPWGGKAVLAAVPAREAAAALAGGRFQGPWALGLGWFVSAAALPPPTPPQDTPMAPLPRAP